MKAILEPGSISGNLVAPPSKSMTQRAYAAALLHRGTTIIHYSGNSADEAAALNIIQQLGAQVTVNNNSITIISNGINPITDYINCGESGLSARLFTPIAALSANSIKVNGEGSLLNRSMKDVDVALTELGVSLAAFNGYLPFTLQGPLQARSIKINAGDSSQFLSGLLFALTYAAKEPITIEVAGLKSRPYIDMTLEVLAHFGRPITHNSSKEFYIDPALFSDTDPIEFNVEADWSSAAFFLVAAAIAGEITIANLSAASKQADNAIIEVLRTAGAEVTIADNTISVKKAALQAFEFDATECPDLFPILAILAANCDGESYITGVHRLFNKESNRAESISEMLQDFDVPFSVEDDMLCITGVKSLQGTIINGYNDHRIVMAAAIGALKANGPVEIAGAGAINKSYPGFFKHLSLCGGKLLLQ